MQLTLGPVLFNWQPSLWRDFYFRIADEAPVDCVAIGEVVCSKRWPFFADLVPEVIERLSRGGKKVLLSSLALVTLDRERRVMGELASRPDIMVEANDISCIAGLGDRPHAIGPFVNVYNEATAAYFAGGGADRICLPPELPLSSVAVIAAAVPDVAVEILAFGRVPLSISARCYHARLRGLSKDNCRFVCDQDPDGLVVDTLDGEHFLAINGVQTLSYACVGLIGELDRLTASGVASCRLSPQSCDMVAVARAFRDVLDGRLDAAEGKASLNAIFRDAPLINGFLNGQPGAEWVQPHARRRRALGAADREPGLPSE
ncbi:ubiquinone anaerobic biosynthesis protein UbiV [Bauldia litoralis]|uniref:ubiquinone anaerobic biosynthesis protein UbiV n=1 Tax=Bauldia litoralis TaxID=665467 RepID=UPI003265ED6B